jgi:hypothetical protein
MGAPLRDPASRRSLGERYDDRLTTGLDDSQ